MAILLLILTGHKANASVFLHPPNVDQSKFLIPWARKGKVQEKATDERVGDHLWDWLEEQVKDIPRAKT